MSEGLNLLKYTATGINKDDPLFQAVFSNWDGDGAIANEFDALVSFIDYYITNANVNDHVGDSLDMIVTMFIKLERKINERDQTYLRRMNALTARKGDKVWGTKWNMKHIFETYFEGVHVFVCENTNKDTMLKNGDFEETTDWIFDGNAGYDRSARFSANFGAKIDKTGSIKQNIVLTTSVYCLHFFLKGQCGVIIKNNSGKYWNGNNNVLDWSDDEVINNYRKEDWENVEMFLVPTSASMISIEFFGNGTDVAFIDYVRLFKKPLNPSYTIIIQYDGYGVYAKTLHLGKGEIDPDDDIDYKKESYFDKSYIIGKIGAYPSGIYQSLLDSVRPRGIQAFVEYVEKTADDGQGEG